MIVAAEGSDHGDRRRALEAAGAEVLIAPSDATGRVDVAWVARHLADRGMLDVMLESGGELAASFWDAGLVSRALFFVAPKIVGGRESLTPVGGAGRDFMRAYQSFTSLAVSQCTSPR